MTAATEMIPNAPRVVGVATNYLELIQSFRARLAELEISYETLDEIAGWTTRYGSKLLASEPSRNLGPIALDAMLGATGLKIALIEDRERLESSRRRNSRRSRRRPRRRAGAIRSLSRSSRRRDYQRA